jgi:hypothetical protein
MLQDTLHQDQIALGISVLLRALSMPITVKALEFLDLLMWRHWQLQHCLIVMQSPAAAALGLAAW